MDLEVPPDFDKPWRLSDVVIHANNSDGKDIHAYKGALATFSPYFNVLFFGDFKEENCASVNVDCDRNVMVEILKHIHRIGYKYNVTPKPYSSEMLVKLYNAADFYDFAFIREMCLDQMAGTPRVDMFTAARQLKLYDLRAKIVKKMNKKEVDELLRHSKFEVHFTKEEFLVLFQKEVGKPVPKSKEKNDEKPKEVLNLEEITEDLENRRVDITKPWPTADLAIIADNALGRILYANKAVVEMMCNKFQKYLCKTDTVEFSGHPVKFFAVVDEEYAAVKEIDERERILHPALLHAMYHAADETSLDIASIRNFCLANLAKQKTVDALDVLCRSAHNSKHMCKKMSALSIPQLRDWIYGEDLRLSYRKGQVNFAVTHSQKEPLIWKSLACWLINQFKAEYFKEYL